MSTPTSIPGLLPSSTTAPRIPPNLTTRTLVLSPITLNASTHLPKLFKVINHCFTIAHNPEGHSYLPPSTTSRLRTYIQLSEEIGPDGFTIIMLAQDTSIQVNGEGEGNQERKGETVIATASAKPFVPPEPDNNELGRGKASALFKRQPGTDNALAAYAELPKWEILCMVVEPTLQGRGIAGQLMGLTIEEIKRRIVESKNEGYKKRHGGNGGINGEANNFQKNIKAEDDDEKKGKGKGEVLLMLSSMQELNESYYAKRGWQTTSVRRFPPGTMGSRDGFGVMEMMKVVSFGVLAIPITSNQYLPLFLSLSPFTIHIPQPLMMVGNLLDEGASIHAAGTDGFGLLHLAAYFGKASVISTVFLSLKSLGSRIKKQKDQQQVIDINAGHPVDGNTPLGIAAAKGHLAAFEELLGNDADLKKTNHQGWNPLHIAAVNKKRLILKAIFDHCELWEVELDVNVRDKKGRTALMLLEEEGAEKAVVKYIAKMLIAKGAKRLELMSEEVPKTKEKEWWEYCGGFCNVD